METCFVKNLDINQKNIKIEGDAFKHIKALRLQSGDKIDLTSGDGFILESLVESIDKNSCICIVQKTKELVNENLLNLTLAIGILDSADRMEFAIEKAVELGVNRIIPLICRYSQKKNIRKERLTLKAISALEQSKRCKLPEIMEPITVKDLLGSFSENSSIILGDIDGEKPFLQSHKDAIIFIGPEGGFSNDEINLIKSQESCLLWKLSNTRLRAETAAISAISCFNALI